jgi:hypothetical protein
MLLLFSAPPFGKGSMLYNSFNLLILGYGTPAATLLQQECYKIHKPVGTSQYGGLGLALHTRDISAYNTR